MTLPTVDGLQQAPEGAEQAEEDEQAGEIAQHLASVVEPDRDRFEQARCLAGGKIALLQRRQHGGKRADHLVAPQGRAGRIGGKAGGGAGLAVDTPEFAQRQEDADRERAGDQAVQARIGHEGGEQARLQDEDQEADQREEDQRAEDIAQRAGEAERLRPTGHRRWGLQRRDLRGRLVIGHACSSDPVSSRGRLSPPATPGSS